MDTIKITSVKRKGDLITVIGKVDGHEVTATTWQSHLVTLAGKLERKEYLRLLLAAVGGEPEVEMIELEDTQEGQDAMTGRVLMTMDVERQDFGGGGVS